MRSAFASLTSRLVLITVALVALVSLLLGAATTLVLRGYLMGQLDGKVHGSLERAAQADVILPERRSGEPHRSIPIATETSVATVSARSPRASPDSVPPVR